MLFPSTAIVPTSLCTHPSPLSRNVKQGMLCTSDPDTMTTALGHLREGHPSVGSASAANACEYTTLPNSMCTQGCVHRDVYTWHENK